MTQIFAAIEIDGEISVGEVIKGLAHFGETVTICWLSCCYQLFWEWGISVWRRNSLAFPKRLKSHLLLMWQKLYKRYPAKCIRCL